MWGAVVYFVLATESRCTRRSEGTPAVRIGADDLCQLITGSFECTFLILLLVVMLEMLRLRRVVGECVHCCCGREASG